MNTLSDNVVAITAPAFTAFNTTASSPLTLVTYDHFLRRLIGLIGRRALDPTKVFHFLPCNSIHTFGMFVPLTVIFLDRQRRVLRFIAHLAPARIAWQRDACSVLELRAGLVTSEAQARELVACLFLEQTVRPKGF